MWVAAAGILAGGCDSASKGGHEPDQIQVISSDPQYGLAGSNHAKRVIVEVLTAPIPGILGGEGVRRPVVGERVLLRPLDPQTGMRPQVSEGVTDSGGRFVFDVTLGPLFGDQYLEVSCASRPSVKKRLRFISGVQIANNKQEAGAGQSLPNPLRITLLDAEERPLAGVPVFFTLIREPSKGGKLTPTAGMTDETGAVEVELTTVAGKTGVYEVSVEIADAAGGRTARPIRLEARAMHVGNLAIGVLGGLAIFVFGMTLMSDGLQQVAGNRLKRVLGYITGNHVMAIFAGATVTGLIQSSSAATVMTVGFVNAGLLTLKQAIGVVFGANIGTTITGQMVSFKLDGLALPAIALGVLLLLTLRRAAGQGVARTLLGFGLLFFGMTLMSDQLKNVSSFPSFVKVFQLIDCQPLVAGGAMPFKTVLAAIGIGTLMTVIVQSSSATIGLAIALAGSGLLNIWTAIPIVLGDNIGTTITAIFASISANRAAKQTALAHSLFNILGTVVMVCLFYVPIAGVPCFFFAVDHITRGEVFFGENLGRHVASAHSLFNVVNVIIFMPFIGALAWLCGKLVPDRPVAARPDLVNLDRHWLTSPPVALAGAVRATANMTEKAWRLTSLALDSYRSGKAAPLAEIERSEDETDETQRLIMDYLMDLTRRELSEEQAQAIPSLMHCVSDAERIADIGLAIAELVPKQPSAGGALTETAQREIDEIIGKTRQLAQCVLDGLHAEVSDVVEDAMRLEGQVRMLCKLGEQRHIERLQRGECTLDRGIVYVEVLALLESIARHLGNIATRTEPVTSEMG